MTLPLWIHDMHRVYRMLTNVFLYRFA
jgi:hypothetical protein